MGLVHTEACEGQCLWPRDVSMQVPLEFFKPPRLRDKIREWPGEEATINACASLTCSNGNDNSYMTGKTGEFMILCIQSRGPLQVHDN